MTDAAALLWSFDLFVLVVVFWQLRPAIAARWAALSSARPRFTLRRFMLERAWAIATAVGAVLACLSLAYLVWHTRIAAIVTPR